jgi:hypothetical protein
MAGVKGRSGGVREGAGRKPAPPKMKRASKYQTQDPDDFLRAAMADPTLDFKDRFAAALALKKSGKGGAPVGKKQAANEAAQAVVGRNLTPVSAPTKGHLKLVASK